MNIKIATASILTIFALNSSVTFATDAPPANSLPMSKILQNIQKEGYSVVKKIEYDDGKYEVKAIDNAGNDAKLEIAPTTGEIIKPKDEVAPKLSIFDAVSKVETAGYKNIYKIETSKDKYEVKAYDKNNKKVSLDVDANSGAIKD
jgi:hypothetical protein